MALDEEEGRKDWVVVLGVPACVWVCVCALQNDPSFFPFLYAFAKPPPSRGLRGRRRKKKKRDESNVDSSFCLSLQVHEISKRGESALFS